MLRLYTLLNNKYFDFTNKENIQYFVLLFYKYTIIYNSYTQTKKRCRHKLFILLYKFN